MKKQFPTSDELWFDSGQVSERARIIAILKEELKDSKEPMLGTKGGWREHLIALIKGEK